MKDAKGHGSDPRGKAMTSAQAAANRSGKPMSVLNLNTVGQAMHVVRDYDPGHETGMYAHQFVAKVDPVSDKAAADMLAGGHPKSETVPVHSGAAGSNSALNAWGQTPAVAKAARAQLRMDRRMRTYQKAQRKG